MEHRGEVEIGRQPQGGKAIADDPQPGQCLVVRPARQAVGQHFGARVFRMDRRNHGRDERPAERGVKGDVFDVAVAAPVRR